MFLPISETSLLDRIAKENGDERWITQISEEITTAFHKLKPLRGGIAVFGSARPKTDSSIYQTGIQVGRALAEAGYEVITGGGPGLMEAANRGAYEAQGVSVGLGIELPQEQGFNPFLTTSVHFQHFFTRKLMFVRYATAFVVLPGGFGTLDELFECITLVQTGKIHNFPVILFGTRFWQPMLDWIRDQLQENGFIKSEEAEIIHSTDSIDEMLSIIAKQASFAA